MYSSERRFFLDTNQSCVLASTVNHKQIELPIQLMERMGFGHGGRT
jgi:hypothetical protein